MKKIVPILLVIFFFSVTIISAGEGNKMEKKANIYSFVVKDINGKEVNLSDYKGKVVLIVNVASKCGYTRQYEGLQKIYDKYSEKGFEILAFPCNDFRGQEPGTNDEIKEFCSLNYGVTFRLFDKIKVLGDDKAPLYQLLTDNEVTGTGDIKWNFEKFLINKDGEIVERYVSKVEPESEELVGKIEELLK